MTTMHRHGAEPPVDPDAGMQAATATLVDDDTVPATPRTLRDGRRGPVTWLLDVFSSIRLGVTLMVLIFIYSSIGSAGIPRSLLLMEPETWLSVREVFDISEFQWFHWWPFDLMIGLFCVNLTVATIRRIPFKVVNLGVWMIHTGLIILALGSIYYFSAKKEGDAPVPRRDVVVRVPGATEPVRMVASPGNRVQAGTGDDAYRLRIRDIVPDWELLSGDDAGKRVYKVSVEVQQGGELFIRELIDGYPQYTEDLVFSGDPQQPVQRAKNALGTPIIDDDLDLALDYSPSEWVYLMESRALYVRELGATTWVERPIRKLPLFNDRIASYDHVWLPGTDRPELRPISVTVPATDPDDPAPDVEFSIGEYLRYATMQTRRIGGGERPDPWTQVILTTSGGDRSTFELLALDPSRRSALRGALVFDAITDESELERLAQVRPPTLDVRVPGADVETTIPIDGIPDDPEEGWIAIEGTEYALRVTGMQEPLQIGEVVTELAVVDVRRGDEVFTRWVFDRPDLIQDLPQGESLGMHSGILELDRDIEIAYRPGMQQAIRLVAGPDLRQLRVVVPRPGGGTEVLDARPQQPVLLPGDLRLTVAGYLPYSRAETRPVVIPEEQRDRDTGMFASMVRVSVPRGDGDTVARWLPYHLYPFDGPEHVIRRFRYQPEVIELADGRIIEVMFSRERLRLPAPVVLEDFRLRTHQGGFDGMVSSIRDWQSVVRFAEAPEALAGATLARQADWNEARVVKMNDPSENRGFWYFQSQWDPPDQPRFEGDPGSNGLNYTVLGVGNRNGVLIQLFGCCLAVVGMMYAFYVKPWIKRRRQERVLADIREGRVAAVVHDTAAANVPQPALASAGKEQGS